MLQATVEAEDHYCVLEPSIKYEIKRTIAMKKKFDEMKDTSSTEPPIFCVIIMPPLTGKTTLANGYRGLYIDPDPILIKHVGRRFTIVAPKWLERYQPYELTAVETAAYQEMAKTLKDKIVLLHNHVQFVEIKKYTDERFCYGNTLYQRRLLPRARPNLKVLYSTRPGFGIWYTVVFSAEGRRNALAVRPHNVMHTLIRGDFLDYLADSRIGSL